MYGKDKRTLDMRCNGGQTETTNSGHRHCVGGNKGIKRGVGNALGVRDIRGRLVLHPQEPAGSGSLLVLNFSEVLVFTWVSLWETSD